MSDAPKSAYEIAMEKLRQRDQERGEKSPARLTAAQKRAIGEIRKKYEARVAEMEILHRSNRTQAAEDAEALEKQEEEYVRERRRLEEQRDREIEEVRAGRGDGKLGQ
jgi:hypothetical protein